MKMGFWNNSLKYLLKMILWNGKGVWNNSLKYLLETILACFMSYYLWTKAKQNEDGIFISQEVHAMSCNLAKKLNEGVEVSNGRSNGDFCWQ